MSRFFAMFGLLAAAACEPAWSVQGHVRGADAGAVRGAGVALRCPGQQDLAATTDHQGVFELGGRGPGPSLACSVVVAAPSYAPVRVSLADVCEDARDEPSGSCEVAMVDAELRRR
jgi:hypothetical protein